MADSHGIICDTCNRVVYPHRQLTIKKSSCCGNLKTIHIKCQQVILHSPILKKHSRLMIGYPRRPSNYIAVNVKVCVFCKEKHIYELITTSPYTIASKTSCSKWC